MLGAQQRLRPVGPAPLIGGKGIKEQALERRKTLRVPRACSYRNLLSQRLCAQQSIFDHKVIAVAQFSDLFSLSLSCGPACTRKRESIKDSHAVDTQEKREKGIDAAIFLLTRTWSPLTKDKITRNLWRPSIW